MTRGTRLGGRLVLVLLLGLSVVGCSEPSEPATDEAHAFFEQCMRERGVELDSLDLVVNRDRTYYLRGFSAGDVPEGLDPSLECENAMIRRLGLRPE